MRDSLIAHRPLPAPPNVARPSRPRKVRWAARWARRFAALGLGCVLSAVLLEILVLCCFGEQAKFPRHVVEAAWGLRYNEPGARYRHKSADVNVRFHINAQGMRADRNYAYAKPAGVKRILSLGDSFTAGYEVKGKDTFSSILQRELQAAGHAVEVLNAGVSGFSTAEACLYLERELLKYDPDIVVISYYVNDLVDNVRADLLRLEDGRLVEGRQRYVPAGRLGNFLNSNPVFNWLSEYSNAFVFLKEKATHALKKKIVALNKQNLTAPSTDAGDGVAPQREQQRRLAAAIYERLFQQLRVRNIPLIIQSIPPHDAGPDGLQETFPLEYFDVMRPDVLFLPAKALLDPFVGRELLYWRRSHLHWTPFSHMQSGRALAELVLSQHLLD